MSRLDEIKNKQYTGHLNNNPVAKFVDYPYVNLSKADYDWLIQQAERVEELERKLRVDNELFEMQVQQNQRYKQALEFYAGIRNYHSELWENTAIEDDCGRIARRTLADNHD